MDVLFKIALLIGITASLFFSWHYLRKILALRKTYVAGCGHETKCEGVVTVKDSGAEREISLVLDLHNGRPKRCFACLQKMIIPCAWCGNSIAPEDPVTICVPKNPDYTPPVGARVFTSELPHNDWHALKNEGREKDLPLIGCFRQTCMESSEYDRVGFWAPPGIVYCVQPVLSREHAMVMIGIRPSDEINVPNEKRLGKEADLP